MASRGNDDDSHTFVNQRKYILAESQNIGHRQENSKTAIIEVLRSSKKNTDIYRNLVALCAYSFKLVKSKDSFEVVRAYKAKDILAACELYLQSEGIPAFIESIGLKRKTEALKVVADAIQKEEENIKVLNETLTDLGEKSKVYEIYLKELEAAQYSLTNKVKLMSLAKKMPALY